MRHWTERSDPVLLFARRLAASREELQAMDASVREEIAGAVDFALNSPEPAAEAVMDFMFAPPGPSSPARGSG